MKEKKLVKFSKTHMSFAFFGKNLKKVLTNCFVINIMLITYGKTVKFLKIVFNKKLKRGGSYE